jgi:hypothetical protein
MVRWFGVLCCLLLLPWPGWAANKILTMPESAITFADAGQSPTVTLTLTGLAAGACRVSARLDRGATARATRFKWRHTFALTGTLTLREPVELYLASSDGTHPDGEVGTVDAAMATAKRDNLQSMGVCLVDQTTTNIAMTCSGETEEVDRYLSVAVCNMTSFPFQGSTAVHRVILTPEPLEVQ